MDDRHWFDAFHRKYVRDVDRRGLLRATASLAAGLVVIAVPPATAKNRKQKGNGNGNGDKKGRRDKRDKKKKENPGGTKPAKDVCFDTSDDGRQCAGTCGICYLGGCVQDSTRCPPCHRCDSNGNCVPLSEGTPCGGNCGTCQGGECLAAGRLCEPCGACDTETLTCVGDPDREGSRCGGECSTCRDGVCGPDRSRCGPCGSCSGTPSTCVGNPVLHGKPCGEGKVCSYGLCVDIEDCPTGPRTQALGPAASAADCEACPTGLTPCGNQCVDTNNDPDHCGGCFASNPNGLKCCQGNLCHYIDGVCCGATCYPSGWPSCG